MNDLMRSKSKVNQLGVTVVELVVALALGAVVTTGVIRIVDTNRTLSSLINNIGSVQEDARIALSIMKRDILSADYVGCLNQAYLNRVQSLLATPPAVDTQFDTGAFSASLDVSYEHPRDSVNRSSDQFTVQSLEPVASGRINSDVESSLNTFEVLNGSDIAVTDVLVITDCDGNSDVFQPVAVSTPSGSNVTTITYADPSASPPVKLSSEYSRHDRLYKVVQRNYYVAANAFNSSSLFYSENSGAAQELVENVEAMQLAFGVDNNADGVVDTYQSSAPTGSAWEQIVSLHVEIMVSGTSARVMDEAASTSFSSLVGGDSSPSDQRVRRVFKQRISLRSRLR